MNFFTEEQEQKFQINCTRTIPEYMLRKIDNDDFFSFVFSNNEANMYIPLYKYDSEFLNFVLGRLHYYIIAWFDDNNTRIHKGNYYLTSGSRSEIQNFITIFNQLPEFFSKNGMKFSIAEVYYSKISEINEIILNAPPNEFYLPYSYRAIEKNIIDEPIFRIKKDHQFDNAKYLIFGVSKTKPDIRVKQVIDGNLEVMNSEDMLVYDEEIGDSLLYKDFNAWWLKNKNRYSWYDRTKHLQPKEIRVQDYYKKNYYNENHPVLIPQVYLHFDPKSKEERKNCKFNETLIFQRMDFLMIYKGKRIIIEIDGYSHLMTNGVIDITKYSQQLEYDRTMKFLGYDVFRICNCELDERNFEITLDNFFKNLYSYLGILEEVLEISHG